MFHAKFAANSRIGEGRRGMVDVRDRSGQMVSRVAIPDLTDAAAAHIHGVELLLRGMPYTCGLGLLIGSMGAKRAIIVGLVFEVCQLAMFGFSSSAWILWTAGGVAGLGTITYPALSAFLSNHANSDQQGLAQGLLTGIRGLCGGLGPALYGFIFFIFQVDLSVRPSNESILGGLPPPQPQINKDLAPSFQQRLKFLHESLLPGPPFAFGAILALTAIITAIFLPEDARLLAAGPSLYHWGDAEERALIVSALEDNANDDADNDCIHDVQGAENATFVGFYDRRRRAGDKVDKLPHRSLRRSSSPKSALAEGKEHSLLHGLNARLPLILRTRARSRLGFMAAANPLRRIFSGGSRASAPHFSRLTPGDCQTREDLRPASIEEREPLSPWREVTEAADLANYRHHRMQHLFDPQTEARLREAEEVASVRVARLAEGQVGRRSVGAYSAPRGGDFQLNKLGFDGRGATDMASAALRTPVLISSNESRSHCCAVNLLRLLPTIFGVFSAYLMPHVLIFLRPSFPMPHALLYRLDVFSTAIHLTLVNLLAALFLLTGVASLGRAAVSHPV
ncbi:unnamed protein product [Schistocephalus solidus]|uniref:MFS domain-containing protein n=1 Tax=Schistocephalus solidus TaxID=70667 RepID=A0A183SR65_SCHSO|nr:unnamed protein product [Schistocephalus solidus]